MEIPWESMAQKHWPLYLVTIAKEKVHETSLSSETHISLAEKYSSNTYYRLYTWNAE
jgi:hypothetical protein